MRIAFINNNFQLGGAETVVRQLHFGCREAGHQSHLHVAQGKNYPRGIGVRPMYPRLLSRIQHSRFHGIAERLAPRNRWTNHAFRKLAGSRADVIHIHNFHGHYASIESLSYVARRKPVVWTFHRFWGITGGCDHPGDCRRYLEACGQCPRVEEWPICGVDNTAEQLQQKLEHLAGAPLHIVAPSKHLARMVATSRVGRRWKVDRIPNGVAPEQFSFLRKHDPDFRESLRIDPDATAILIVNRDFQDSLKGFETIRPALLQIQPKGLQFVFAGGNSAWAIRQLPVSFRCADAGYVSSRATLAALYEAADILLYASPRENFPCVTLEAMSAKCCIVSTPTDGVTEQVEHGISGFLAASFEPDALATALKCALANPDQMRSCAENARERVEAEFSEKAMLDRHLALYREMLG